MQFSIIEHKGKWIYMRKKIKKKFTSLSIANKMLTIYISFASIFFLIALVLIQIGFGIYSQELYEKSVQELDYFSQNVNDGLKEAERMSYSISMDTLIQQNLEELSRLPYPSVEYSLKLYEIRNALLNEYDPESCIKSIIYMDLYGNKVEIGTSAWQVSDESIKKIRDKAMVAQGAYITYGPTEDCPYLLSGRLIRNRLDMSLNNLGKLVLVCDVNSIIQQNKEQLSSDQAAVYVYSKECAVYEDENIKRINGLPTGEEKTGYKIVNESGEKFFVSYLYSDSTGWTYISFFPYSDIYGQVQAIQYLLFTGFIGVFIILVFFMKKVSRLMTEPLEKLTDSMQVVGTGDFQAANEMLVISDRTDEIGMLSREFKAMLDTVEHLIKENYEKQLLLKDTKYKMLRAQINPHFLYNTLNVIHWMIRAGRNEEAGRMIIELGAILRYSFSQVPYATIKDEVNMVNSFILIQKTRYQERINFTVETEGKLDEYIMPRMILQPLIENAISYGAEPYSECCTIMVCVQETESEILMTVEDTGAGMSPDELEAVRKLEFKPKGHGIGIKNIVERLKMDDEDSSFEISSERGKGTLVTIKIHKRTKGDQNV